MGADYYRITTHDLRPPVRGGEPTPHVPGELLPAVEVDASPGDCRPGWHACASPEAALRIAGEWPDGRPSRLWRVEAVGPVYGSGDKRRAATWRVIEEVGAEEARAARLRLYAPVAGDGLPVEEIVAEVEAWRVALARPRQDVAAVEAGLRAALEARGLSWDLRAYPTAWAAGAAGAAWDAWDAGAAGDAWAAGDAGDAGDALKVYIAARRGWTQQRPDLLTVGLRDAYASGLGCCVPVEPGVLGYWMEVSDGR